MTFIKHAFALLLLVLVIVSCGTDDGGPLLVCEPGETKDCFCEPEVSGIQICVDDGSGWGECSKCQECTADCSGKVCGDDGCGGTCGDCEIGFTCDSGTCVEGECVPDCDGKDCGDDGCGGSCGDCVTGLICNDGQCVDDGICEPDCDGKDCGDDGCDGSCGDCSNEELCFEGACQCEFAECSGGCCLEGEACYEESCCAIDCTDKECGDDGCGGLCNGCLDIVHDDGSTETAYGYGQEPDHAPSKMACAVRFDLPSKNMKLVRFTAGWMWGLYNLEVPFELVYVTPEGMECDQGSEGIWYNEWCTTTPESMVSIGNFIPLEPYTAMEQEELGDVVFPSETVYLAAVFDIDQYPFFVCPIDDSGEGDYAFMMSDYLVAGDKVAFQGASFHTKEKNTGVVPFSIRVETTE